MFNCYSLVQKKLENKIVYAGIDSIGENLARARLRSMDGACH